MTFDEAVQAMEGHKLVRHQPANRNWGMYGYLAGVHENGTALLKISPSMQFEYPITEMAVVGS